jgi:hypothetical protein
MVEVAGPEKHAINTLVESWMRATGDQRPVIADPKAPYFGVELDDGSLTPASGARLMPTRFADWLKQSGVKQSA